MQPPPFEKNRRFLAKLVREIEQTLVDVASYNDMPQMAGRPPMDVETERIVLAKARRGVEACDRRDWPEVCRIVRDLEEFMTASGWGEDA